MSRFESKANGEQKQNNPTLKLKAKGSPRNRKRENGSHLSELRSVKMQVIKLLPTQTLNRKEFRGARHFYRFVWDLRSLRYFILALQKSKVQTPGALLSLYSHSTRYEELTPVLGSRLHAKHVHGLSCFKSDRIQIYDGLMKGWVRFLVMVQQLRGDEILRLAWAARVPLYRS